MNRLSAVGLLVLSLSLSGCASLGYYLQAAEGQLEVLSRRQPIERLLNDPETGAALKARLARAVQMRRFAVEALDLPDGGSFGGYADLERSQALWALFAAPRFSLEPRPWCFLVVGCLSYKGFFDEAEARAAAAALKAEGWDVHVADVAAYSTLGWFDDPLLNTYLNWPEGHLAELIFHELSHEKLFIPGDPDFNESYAETVGRNGALRWLESTGRMQALADHRAYLARQEAFLILTAEARERLRRLYAEAMDDDRRLDAKAVVIAWMRRAHDRLRAGWGGRSPFDRWFAEEINNAKLAAITTYNRWVPAFQALLRQQGDDMTRFHAAAAVLVELAPDRREAALRRLAAEGREAALAETPTASQADPSTLERATP